MHVAVLRQCELLHTGLEAIGPAMASTSKSLAEMNKSGDGSQND
jgi:hypothetical protein